MVHFPKWQVILVAVVLVLGLLYAAPNLVSRDTAESLPGWAPNQQIHLGLDLQGGVYLLMEVDLEEVFKEQREELVNVLRADLKEARIKYRNLGISNEAVGFDLLDPEKAERARGIIRDRAVDLDLSEPETGQFRLSMSDTVRAARAKDTMDQTTEIIGIRLNEFGTSEPSIQRQGENRIVVQFPGVDDPERVKELIGKTAKLAFRFVVENSGSRIPAGAEPLKTNNVNPLTGVKDEYVVRKRAIVKGENLTDAQATFQDAQPVVSFSFDTVGAKRFGDATRDNVGRVFAIILDDEVISAPVIREPILGGNGVISGTFTVQEANDLALLLRAGALPADLTFLEERTVGPGLGADSIAAGKIASVLGLVFVIIFMVVAYGRFGAMADVALVTNLVLIAAVLSTLQATLTLPGIAGIVLTIGMAVDANVLIFERIREELHVNSRGPVNAIDAGYKRAMTTIIDSNVTTLIAAVLLFQFGSGPVKGFAVTLAIGLVTSMFTAIMLTRFLVVTWLRRTRPQTLPI